MLESIERWTTTDTAVTVSNYSKLEEESSISFSLFSLFITAIHVKSNGEVISNYVALLLTMVMLFRYGEILCCTHVAVIQWSVRSAVGIQTHSQ